jgi:hypothetical protein
MISLVKFKIISEFQKNKFYNARVEPDEDPNYGKKDDNLINDSSKYHFFRVVNIDTTWYFNDNTSYIFPIFIDNLVFSVNELTFFLNKFKIFIEEHEELFLNKKLIPVFLDPFEGNIHVGDEINNFTRTYNNIQFYHISADYKLKYKENKFKFCYVNMWQYRLESQENIIDYIPKKDYINLNRMPRLHRCLLIQSLIDNSLLSNGYNSWAPANTTNNSMYSNGFLDIFRNKYPNNTIEQQRYDILDVVDIEHENPNSLIPIEHCRESFMYIVTETHFDNECFFISEKSYKPIAIGMPFMILGNPGTLQYFREKGYATFSNWIDESYDMDLPLEDRINIIVQNLIKISTLHNIEKINIRRQMNEICKHNLDLYKLLNRKNNLIETLKLIEKQMI